MLIAFENKNFLSNNIIKFLIIIQLILSQFSFTYFNYEYYINKSYNQFAYQYENEKYISKLITQKKSTIVLSEIDGNFFKDYQFLNIDIYNFSPSVYFKKTLKFLENKDEINTVIIILKKKMEKFEDYLFIAKNFIISVGIHLIKKRKIFYL